MGEEFIQGFRHVDTENRQVLSKSDLSIGVSIGPVMFRDKQGKMVLRSHPEDTDKFMLQIKFDDDETPDHFVGFGGDGDPICNHLQALYKQFADQGGSRILENK